MKKQINEVQVNHFPKISTSSWKRSDSLSSKRFWRHFLKVCVVKQLLLEITLQIKLKKIIVITKRDDFFPASAVHFSVPVKIVTIFTNPVKLSKDSGGIHAPATQLNMIFLLHSLTTKTILSYKFIQSIKNWDWTKYPGFRCRSFNWFISNWNKNLCQCKVMKPAKS